MEEGLLSGSLSGDYLWAARSGLLAFLLEIPMGKDSLSNHREEQKEQEELEEEEQEEQQQEGQKEERSWRRRSWRSRKSRRATTGAATQRKRIHAGTLEQALCSFWILALLKVMSHGWVCPWSQVSKQH